LRGFFFFSPSLTYADDMQERDSARSKAFLKAHVRVGKLPKMECVVRDISLGGARIEVDETFALPTEFALEIPQRGAMLLCELQWRNGDAVGVKFLDRQAPHAPTIEEVEELRRENARLRQEIARLTARVQELIGGR
jgi:PilZ domain